MARKSEERRLLKSRYIKGAIRTASGTDIVKIRDSSGIGFEKIIIKGKTTHKEKTHSEILMGLLRGGQYTSAGVSGAVAYKLPEGWAESQLSFTPVITGASPGFSVSLADGQSFLFSSSVELLSTQGEVNPFFGSGYGYIIVSGITSGEDLNALWENVAIDVSSLGTYLGKREYEIVNTGDMGCSILLRSKNLLDHNLFTRTVYDGITLQPEGHTIHMTGTGKRDIYTSPFFNNPDKMLDISNFKDVEMISACAYFDDPGCRAMMQAGFYDSTGAVATSWINSFNNMVSMPLRGRDQLMLVIRFYKDVTYDTKIRIMLFEGTEESMPEFVPYFAPVRVDIPREITLSDGSVLKIKLAGYGDKCDYIEADNQKGRVLYYCHVLEQDSSKPADMQVLLDEPIVYDLSECEFAKELLSLNVPYKNGGTLRAEGASAIEVKYFATKGEDQVQMTIRYMCDGSQIADDFLHKVRKGSFYHVSHPHISGYRSKGEDVKGNANKDTEIILEYKKG
ncbi:MAG: hypothetical protein IKB27_02720 [Clostridia bacterium]|nr:hypothetical protein [Clostridia bacterium]